MHSSTETSCETGVRAGYTEVVELVAEYGQAYEPDAAVLSLHGEAPDTTVLRFPSDLRDVPASSDFAALMERLGVKWHQAPGLESLEQPCTLVMIDNLSDLSPGTQEILKLGIVGVCRDYAGDYSISAHSRVYPSA